MKATRLLTYLFCISLIVWYLFIIYSAAFPRVSREYKTYYIEQKMTDWPGEGGLDYNWGEALYFDRSGKKGEVIRLRDKGWYRKTEFIQWSEGARAGLILKLDRSDSQSDRTLEFEVKSNSQNPNQKMRIYLNEEKIGEIIIESQFSEFQIPIAASLITSPSDELDHIEFAIDKIGNATIDDKTRQTGFAMNWFRIE